MTEHSICVNIYILPNRSSPIIAFQQTSLKMKITSILTLALAPLTLAKTLTLYLSSHETGYSINFPNDNSVAGVKLSDDKGALKVYGSLTYTQPGETTIALNNGQDTAWVCLLISTSRSM